MLKFCNLFLSQDQLPGLLQERSEASSLLGSASLDTSLSSYEQEDSSFVGKRPEIDGNLPSWAGPIAPLMYGKLKFTWVTGDLS
ncbi:hypothetical protein CROQUDRAFT_93626 [Cronartium quercuum f. sp. fusiforme G11]|uniref:Uncharacterized protein n=1 Tax=Cronartium quercuum f. sp. fusiforme G11 TaxID=708437 RepID=A0A9P6NK60_9BASI|nr:hypothetical protein CROQUDRAFT_93626 [Cronartium quercuum f. sp. fusiforme G11]